MGKLGVVASKALVVLVALQPRLWLDRLEAQRPGFSFDWGGEMASVARALASGHGFSSPYWQATGATAIVPPVYPLLLSWLLSFGPAAALLALLFNATCSALVCLPLWRLGDALRPGLGKLAAWTWALSAWLGYSEAIYLWNTSFYALTLTGALAALLASSAPMSWRRRLGVGALLGFSLLLDPAHALASLVVLTLLGLSGFAKPRELWAIAATAVLVSAPWAVRNSVVLDEVTYLRSNAPHELYRGVVLDPTDLEALNATNPGRNAQELKRYRQLGEREYMREKGRLATAFVRAQPELVLGRCLRKVVLYWAGNRDLVWLNQWRLGSGARIKHLLFFLPVLAASIGMWFGLRSRSAPVARALLAFLLVFSLAYYVAPVVPRFRAPLEPLLWLLVALGAQAAWQRRTRPAATTKWRRGGFPASGNRLAHH